MTYKSINVVTRLHDPNMFHGSFMPHIIETLYEVSLDKCCGELKEEILERIFNVHQIKSNIHPDARPLITLRNSISNAECIRGNTFRDIYCDKSVIYLEFDFRLVTIHIDGSNDYFIFDRDTKMHDVFAFIKENACTVFDELHFSDGKVDQDKSIDEVIPNKRFIILYPTMNLVNFPDEEDLC